MEKESEYNPVKSESSPTPQERIVELEKELENRREDIEALRRSETTLKDRLEAANGDLKRAVDSYKASICQLNPEITVEMVRGDSVEAVDDSLAKAVEIVKRVRRSVENQISQTKVPAGAPGRNSPDLSGLSPHEKILYAVGGKK